MFVFVSLGHLNVILSTSILFPVNITASVVAAAVMLFETGSLHVVLAVLELVSKHFTRSLGTDNLCGRKRL